MSVDHLATTTGIGVSRRRAAVIAPLSPEPDNLVVVGSHDLFFYKLKQIQLRIKLINLVNPGGGVYWCFFNRISVYFPAENPF